MVVTNGMQHFCCKVNYENNSTLESLFYAQEKILDSTIITYSDIIFDEKILEELLESKNNISP